VTDMSGHRLSDRASARDAACLMGSSGNPLRHELVQARKAPPSSPATVKKTLAGQTGLDRLQAGRRYPTWRCRTIITTIRQTPTRFAGFDPGWVQTAPSAAAMFPEDATGVIRIDPNCPPPNSARSGPDQDHAAATGDQ